MSDEPPVEVGLEIAPSGEGHVMVTGRVRNRSDADVDPQLFASELLIDGEPWFNWRLAIGNGTVDPQLVQLPPGEEAEFSRELDLSRLGGDAHRFVLRMAGAESPPVTL